MENEYEKMSVCVCALSLLFGAYSIFCAGCVRCRDAEEQNNLGKRSLDGTGVEKDEREAAKRHRLAADQGDNDAQDALIRLGY